MNYSYRRDIPHISMGLNLRLSALDITTEPGAIVSRAKERAQRSYCSSISDDLYGRVPDWINVVLFSPFSGDFSFNRRPEPR